MKMKHDTKILASIPLAKYFNFVGEGHKGDPFLI